MKYNNYLYLFLLNRYKWIAKNDQYQPEKAINLDVERNVKAIFSFGKFIFFSCLLSFFLIIITLELYRSKKQGLLLTISSLVIDSLFILIPSYLIFLLLIHSSHSIASFIFAYLGLLTVNSLYSMIYFLRYGVFIMKDRYIHLFSFFFISHFLCCNNRGTGCNWFHYLQYYVFKWGEYYSGYKNRLFCFVFPCCRYSYINKHTD